VTKTQSAGPISCHKSIALGRREGGEMGAGGKGERKRKGEGNGGER